MVYEEVTGVGKHETRGNSGGASRTSQSISAFLKIKKNWGEFLPLGDKTK